MQSVFLVKRGIFISFFPPYFGSDWHMGSMIALVLLVVVFLSTWLSGGFSSEENVRGANL